MKRDLSVLGHLCEGLDEFQEAGKGCVPNIGSDGCISGCDDYNIFSIVFCPFCGVRLAEDDRKESVKAAEVDPTSGIG